MKILLINKFLHPNGGSETYVFRLGEALEGLGHEVQYFGMEHPDRIVGNRAEAYTSNMDFHKVSGLKKLGYSLKTIYSSEARKKLRRVLEDFRPDVCHLNNFNYQLTPSIILEIRKWEKQTGHGCRILYTAHDYQLVCPNHMCSNPNTRENCEKCLGGHYLNCTRGRCIHGSLAKSVIGTLEAAFWNRMGIYRQLDTILCCSEFMKSKLDTSPVLAGKTVAIHNFLDPAEKKPVQKQEYVLYFGRFSQEKGIETLVQAAAQLPRIPFVFAGSGPLEGILEGIPNIKNVGFRSGEDLEKLVREARFTVYPSTWYENCPFSVMESQQLGTPVIGADIGGIPELVKPGKNGLLFPSDDADALKAAILTLWEDRALLAECTAGCGETRYLTPEAYCARVRSLVE